MKQDEVGHTTPEDGERPSTRERIQRIAAATAASATTIIALHGTAFAASDGKQPYRFFLGVPILDSTTIAVVGATIATIAGYRLKKAGKRSAPPKDEERES